MHKYSRILIALGALAVAPFLAAWPFHGAPSACLYGTALPDGCPGAPVGGSFQQANFFTYARQARNNSRASPNWDAQIYTSSHPPTWNVAGADYPVGIPAASCTGTCPSGMKDPTPAGVIASELSAMGCSLNSTYPTQYINCTPDGSNHTIDGYDFSLHNCIPLTFIGSSGGIWTVQNSYFSFSLSGSNCDGVSVRNPIWVQNSTVMSLVVKNSHFVGPTNNTSEFGPNNFINFSAYTSGSNLTLQYNAFINNPSKSWGALTGGNVLNQYNYFENLSYCGPQYSGSHAEIDILFQPVSSSITSIQFTYTTVLAGRTSCTMQALYYLSMSPTTGSGWTTNITTVQVDHSVLIVNNNPDMTGAEPYPASSVIDLVGSTAGTTNITNLNIKNNYLDPSGSGRCLLYETNFPVVVTNWDISGNLNLIDGSDENFYTDSTNVTSGPTVSAGASNGGPNLVRLTVSSSAQLHTGQKVWAIVAGTGSIPGQITAQAWTITVINGTTIDLQGSTWTSGTITSGTIGSPCTGGRVAGG